MNGAEYVNQAIAEIRGRGYLPILLVIGENLAALMLPELGLAPGVPQGLYYRAGIYQGIPFRVDTLVEMDLVVHHKEGMVRFAFS